MKSICKLLVLAGASSMVALALFGCSGIHIQEDEAAVRAILEAELEPIVQLDDEFVEAIATNMANEFATYDIDTTEFVEAYLGGFSFEVEKVEIDGNSATAEVIMNCKSLEDYLAVLQEISATTSADSSSLSATTAEEVTAATGEIIVDSWEKVDPTACEPVEISLERVDGEWAVSATSESAIANVLLNH